MYINLPVTLHVYDSIDDENLFQIVRFRVQYASEYWYMQNCVNF